MERLKEFRFLADKSACFHFHSNTVFGARSLGTSNSFNRYSGNFHSSSILVPHVGSKARSLMLFSSNKYSRLKYDSVRMVSSSTPLYMKAQTQQEHSAPSQDSEKTAETSASKSSSDDGLSKREKLKIAIRDYGSTVLVFHVTMSLASLGIFYLLVSSGLDVIGILEGIGISESISKSKVTAEAGKFVVAYAVHKVFAPLRITITLTATPLIVRKLRSMGILKQAAKAKQS